MNKVVAVCLTLSCLFWAAGSPVHSAIAPSLCRQGEKVVFSCTTKRTAKIVSLCSSSKVTKTEGYLQYRFGLPNKIELEYPAEHANPQQAFHYSHYFRARFDLTEISFSVGGYEYKIFDNFNGEEKPEIIDQGVTVTRSSDQKEVTYSCQGKATADFGDLPDVLVNEYSPEF